MDTIRIVTRSSPLALKQTNIVAEQLTAMHPTLKIAIIPIVSEGDKQTEVSLAKIGGKGLFIKSLERALLRNKADIAVHSMKDVPCEMPAGFNIAAALKREDPSDAFVSNHYADLAELPKHAIVGTSSLRRQCQLKHHYPHLRVQPLRGNVGTRLAKLDNGECAALILAAAGLKRLGLSERIRSLLPHRISLPAIGQGVIGIEMRDGHQLSPYITALNDPISSACLQAERALSLALGGDCTMPLAAYAHHDNGNIYISSLIGDTQGKHILRDQRQGRIEQNKQLGQAAANALLSQGAATIIASLQNNE
ncbi:MAG: hydroxymethylbilane synthase [Chromatiales bacterium]|nr:hydroxymethylbilane synthase [Chromatiales bacterium]